MLLSTCRPVERPTAPEKLAATQQEFHVFFSISWLLSWRERYAPRCTTLTAFQRYCGGALLQRGGAGVLQPEMRAIVAPVLARALHARAIPRPDLHKGARSCCITRCDTLD
jgi:hypothetical protein